MLLGVNSTLYESTDQGDHLNSLGPIGNINPSAFAPLAYGGTSGGVGNPDVIYAGGGGNLWLRTSSGGSLTQLTTYTSVGGSTVKAIVLDPDDWHIAYILDYSNNIWRTTDAGATTGNWTDITDNLGSLSSDLRSMEIVDGTPGSIPGDGILLIWGLRGVFRRLHSPAGPFWSLFGDQIGGRIPDVLVTNLHYDYADDILVAGTWGRGVWTVSNALLSIIIPETLQVSGDMDFVGEDDAFRLVVDTYDPSVLDVFVDNSSSFPDFSVKLSQISAIQVDGLVGNNTFIVDESNGPITLPYPVSLGCILSYD